MNANEQFEERAERFYRDTHVMAPGKDEPMLGRHIPYETRTALWELWGKKEAEVADLTAKLAAADANIGHLRDRLQPFIGAEDALKQATAEAARLRSIIEYHHDKDCSKMLAGLHFICNCWVDKALAPAPAEGGGDD